MNDYHINLESQEEAVNSNISVRYKPASNISHYSYIVYKNNQKYKEENVAINEYINITLEDTGSYKIEFHNYDINNQDSVFITGNYVIDKDKPVIEVNQKKIKIRVGQSFDILDGVTATDNIDGDITSKINSNIDSLDLTVVGNKRLVYKVTDKAGNETFETVNINVMDSNQNGLIFVRWTMIGIFIVSLVIFVWYRMGLRKEKRLARYSIAPLKDDTMSLSGKVKRHYENLLTIISKCLSKSVIITKRSQRYQKYIDALGKKNDTTLKFVAHKIMVGLCFALIAIVSKTFSMKVIQFSGLFLAFIVGFYAPDVSYAYKYKRYHERIENDLLQAIIIMNNAFKSGKSITQAVDIVANQLTGVIAEEFKKISLELSFGLSIEVVFSRLAKRVQLEEVNYLTASLTILNKTGGNIIKVFSSIEKTLFNKKKLKLEMKALTGSSRIITYLLIGLPIVFAIFISILNADYFTPLVNNPLGIVILLIILTIYIAYILVVRKVMKIRM